MNPFEILQSVNDLGAIALIMIGSAWLKQFLKRHAA